MNTDPKLISAQVLTIPMGILAGIAAAFALRQIGLEELVKWILIGGAVGALLGIAANSLARKGGRMADLMAFVSRKR